MAQYDFDLREYWRIIKKKKFIIVFTTVAMALFSLIFSILGSPSPLYKTTAAVKFERNSLATGLYLQTISISPGDDMQTQMAVIKSHFIIEPVAKTLGMIPATATTDEIRNNPKYVNVINKLRSVIQTEQESQSAIINITVTSEDAKFAQRLANTVALVYREQRMLEVNKRTLDAKKFIEDQLKISRERLKISEDSVRAYREKNKLISVDAQASALMAQLGSYRTAYDKAVTDRDKIQDAYNQLAQSGTQPFTTKTSFYLEDASATYKALNDRLLQLLMDRDTLLITYTDNFPQVVEIRKRIHETAQTMQAQLAAQGKALRENINILKRKIDDTERQIKSLPEIGLELARLERNVKVDTEVYSLLEKNYQESLIKEAEKVEDVQIVRPALEPTAPTNPPKTAATTGIGTILGFILGLVFAFLIETFDTSIGTIEEVENYLGAPVLGVIPQISQKDLKTALSDKYPGKVDEVTSERVSRLVSHFAPQSTLAESYRSLRTNLNFACREDNIKTVVFTSATPREGKTTSIVNLSITIAQTGQRVLLVEADLRKPVIANMFGIDQTPGITDALMGDHDWEKSVKTIADIMMGKLNIDEVLETPGMDNLHIIPAGTIPPNPAELIGSRALDDFIAWAKSKYDFILIDAPPVLAATDAALLGSKTDATLIVYRVGKIARVTLRRAKSQLENVKARILGVVLNGIKADISADFADYDYKYYHYYGGTKKEKGFLDKLKDVPVMVMDAINSRRAKKDETLPKIDTGKEGQENDHPRGRSWMKMLLLFTALGALVLGIAFQTGYLKAHYFTAIFDAIQSINPLAEKSPSKTTGVKKSISKPEVPAAKAVPHSADQPSAVPTPAVKPSGIAAPDSSKKTKSNVTAAPSLPTADRPYSIQIRAVRDAEEAQRVVAALRSEGRDAYFLKVDFKDIGTWHRIFVGHFSSQDEAARYMNDQRLGNAYPGCLVRNAWLSTRP
jgi:succinoglycan biosynthesis transport protein ExoP